MSIEKLIVFVKAPRPGAVKTRLAHTLGREAACRAYRQLVEILLLHLAPLPNLELRFSPDAAADEIIPWLRPGWEHSPQGGGNLGTRLHAAFAHAFAGSAKRVVIVGSDCPSITVRDIEQAWSSLRSCDVVLGPATDGGYWLIGLRAPNPSLFRGIAWSTSSVLHETRQRARRAELRVHLLRELTDVDTETDWKQFVKNFRKESLHPR